MSTDESELTHNVRQTTSTTHLKGNLSKLLTTKGLFEKRTPPEISDVKLTESTSTGVNSAASDRNYSSVDGIRPLVGVRRETKSDNADTGKSIEKSDQNRRNLSRLMTTKGLFVAELSSSPKDITTNDEQSCVSREQTPQVNKKSAAILEYRISSPTCQKKSLDISSPSSNQSGSNFSRSHQSKRSDNVGIEKDEVHASQKVIPGNFKIPKKQKSSMDNIVSHRELETKRQERRRDITAESGTRNARRDVESGRSNVDSIGKIKSARKRLNKRNRESEKISIHNDVLASCGLPSVDSQLAVTVKTPSTSASKIDASRCSVDPTTKDSLVGNWLRSNPVGEKSNAAGEVCVPTAAAIKKGNVMGHLGSSRPGDRSAVNQFARSLAKVGEEEPVPMIVDIDDFVTGIQQFRKNTDFESRTICGQLTHLRSQMKEEPMMVDGDPISVIAKKRQNKILIVLDTNVLVSDLYLVDELIKGRPGPGPTGSPNVPTVIIVIPWIVLQELDGLKNDRRETLATIKLRDLTSKAVRYLHDLFTNAHPQVRGQTSKEAMEDVELPAECNDDKILQCCLLFKKKGVGKVILFSNDKNLCNKAIVHKVNAYTKETIKSALDKSYPLPAVTSKPQQDLTENVNREAIVRNYKSTLLSVLGDIVKHEMQGIYGDMWLKVVTIRPPWLNPLDVLKCLDKHWIAVFGHCVPRRAKIHMDLVFQKVKDLTSHPSHDELKFLFTETLKLLSYFETRPTTAICTKQGLQSVRELLKGLTASRQEVSMDKQMAGPSAVPPVSGILDDPMRLPMVDEMTPDEHVINVDPLVAVYGVFQRVWSSINHICGSVFDSFGLPNPVAYVRPPILPSPEECFHFIPRFYPVIIEIRDLVRRILRMPLNVSQTEIEFSKLCNRLLNYFSMLGLVSEHDIVEPISPEMLHIFCTTYDKRELLSRGLIQLEECCSYIFRLILTIKDLDI